MTHPVRCASQDDPVDAIVELLVRSRIGCMPVVNGAGRAVGMVTKLDVIERMLPERDPTDTPPPRTARELMMPIAITLGHGASIAHAAVMMAREDVHHVPIVDRADRVVGIVSAMDVVRWLAAHGGEHASG